MKFEELGLSPEVLKGVESKGYKKATPIQAQAIPLILEGKDLLGGAQTGTGKTAAFALPILELLSRYKQESPAPRALILTPTRELADQVSISFSTYGQFVDLKITKLFGGVKMNPQIENLKKGTDIVIATPGRLMDHVNQKNIDLSNIKILVLDEADRMLDMGFINDIKDIVESLTRNRQTLLFSATYGNDIENLAGQVLKNPVSVEVTKRNAAASEVQQIVHYIDKKHRFDLLAHLITEGCWYQVLVFVKTKHGAERLTSQLLKAGIPSSSIHGDKSQGARSRALREFKSGDLQALVATDVACRGIDLHDLSHVVNFELPQIPEDYIHRIGRTGRAGKSGVAISLVSYTEKNQLKKIEKILKYEIPQSVVEGFEPKHDIDKDLKKGKDTYELKETIKDNKRSRGTKVKTSRTPKVNTERRGGTSEPKRSRFKSTRSSDQHGVQARSNKPFKSNRTKDKQDNSSRPSNSRTGRDDNRSSSSRPGSSRPGRDDSRSSSSRPDSSRPGRPSGKRVDKKTSGKRNPGSSAARTTFKPKRPADKFSGMNKGNKKR
ncbi:MAG: DEAD/DEAH box helicase [Spirochaetaceae bacterium]|jgi:ATP-dependent RNA helicase RhlE|nr:DEAD/DEAH box helicase [Spirochaetaceae bacterium]